jgi:CDP-paratose 2-epimerase
MTHALITGGAGFIGTNMAARQLADGNHVTILDDLSRPGVERNLAWLRRAYPGDRLRVVRGDVRDRATVRRALADVDQVFHFAAQVAVTTSLVDPVHDFTVNAAGTISLLEELRALPTPPPLLFTSTNKVYGGLDDVRIVEHHGRHQPAEPTVRQRGIGEWRAVSFCSPYGCSKGAADQYVLDYATSYGLPTVVFRMSCIYGPHQRGNEDQGWLAHFVLQALRGEPITIYGDGRQVRDALYVDDLIDAMRLAIGSMPRLRGQAFNIGGGPANTISLLDLLELIGESQGSRPAVTYDAWRVGDQRWYVSDVSRFSATTGWSPQVGVAEGVGRLHAWLRAELPSLAEAV